MSEVKISTGHPDAGRVYAEALDRVTAERDALQLRLTAADERADMLEGLLRDSKGVMSGILDTSYDHEAGDALSALDLMGRVDAEIKPAEGGVDDTVHDRAYRNGLMQGYNLAINGSEKEYQDAVARYSGGKNAE